MSAIRRYLLAGVVALTPIIVVVALVRWLIELSDSAIALLPPHYHPEALFGVDIPGLGIVLALLFIVLVGMLTSHFIGRYMMQLIDRIMGRIPMVRTIYRAIRQLLEATFSDQNRAFERVVMVPFPNAGSLVVGFVTGESAVAPTVADGSARLSVFVPSAPVPTTGWLLFVDPADITFLDISVEEGMRLVLSGGMLSSEKSEKTGDTNR